MRIKDLPGIGMHVIVAMLALITVSSAAEHSPSSSGQRSDSRVEDIYVARSVRESRDPPSEFCARPRSGFSNASSEDHYTFRSTTTRASDGLMVNADTHVIGSLRGCFGATDDPKSMGFYAEGGVGSVTFTGHGECVFDKADFPEPGLIGLRCFLHLSGLPPEYIGGELTTNSIRSRNTIGAVSDPPGYTQPSIATIRVWRRRNQTTPPSTP
jgi:hypothetical protein